MTELAAATNRGSTWNEARESYPRDSTIAELFEEIAARHHDSVAVQLGSQQLTYGELNARANRLARRLNSLGVGPESLVGCCMERSLELILAILGILKAGGAYVPLDPAYPRDRLDGILADTRVGLVLTQRSYGLPESAGRNLSYIYLDEIVDVCLPNFVDSNPARTTGPTNLAYVMYTSGSTGRPKGVMVENRAVVRLVCNTNFCRFGPDEIFLLFAPISFDASTFEIWGALLNGGRLVLMPPRVSSLEDLGRVIRQHGVTTLWLTAGLFHLMVEQRLADLRPIRQLLAGGDTLNPRHVQLVLDNLPNCRLINGYGPTENTTFTCCHVMSPGDPVSETVPIGTQISNTHVYILDGNLRPVGPDEKGELYAAGQGLARGYLANPAATAERFLPDPFAVDASARMYRTGDLVRRRTDGVIEFLGRVDNQVKILGHRVEPGEVEATLAAHASLKQVCVFSVDEEGSKKLAAYYVASPDHDVPPIELRKFLAEKLPQYMIPTYLVPLSSFPLTHNGKVDRTALPLPSAPAKAEAPSDAATSQLQRTIIDLWCRTLRVSHVGLDDNFFDLGGDSLLLISTHSSMQKELHTDIEITDLFEFPTVRTLACRLEQALPPLAPAQPQNPGQSQRAAFSRLRELRKNKTS